MGEDSAPVFAETDCKLKMAGWNAGQSVCRITEEDLIFIFPTEPPAKVALRRIMAHEMAGARVINVSYYDESFKKRKLSMEADEAEVFNQHIAAAIERATGAPLTKHVQEQHLGPGDAVRDAIEFLTDL